MDGRPNHAAARHASYLLINAINETGLCNIDTHRYIPVCNIHVCVCVVPPCSPDSFALETPYYTGSIHKSRSAQRTTPPTRNLTHLSLLRIA